MLSSMGSMGVEKGQPTQEGIRRKTKPLTTHARKYLHMEDPEHPAYLE